MKNCCHDDQLLEASPTDLQQSKTLWIVLWIQIFVFLITFIGGIYAESAALLAESIDFLSHVFLVGMSIYALKRGEDRWVGRVSFIKGAVMLIVAISVILETYHQWTEHDLPSAHAMGLVSIVALVSNIYALYLLGKHRSKDLNMESSWLCSRNHLLTDMSIIFSSVFVYFSNSRLPDTVLGLLLALIIIKSALHIMKRSYEMMQPTMTPSRRLHK